MRRRSFGQSGPIAMRVVMASLAALSIAVIASATETQGVVSPGDSNLTSMSPGSSMSDHGPVDCGEDTHWHGSYKHERRVVGGGGAGHHVCVVHSAANRSRMEEHRDHLHVMCHQAPTPIGG